MDTQFITEQLLPLRQQLLAHPVYQNIQSLQQLKVFMEGHVWAVWDFMSLLKALQQRLSCTQTPWVPTGDRKIRRMINEIVLEEESDVDQQGNPASHFELYIEAMQAIEAKTIIIEQLIILIQQGKPLNQALKTLDIDHRIIDFLNYTFEIIATQESHKIAAAFTFGREDIIPDMFTALVKDLNQQPSSNLAPLIYYLERHIELDAGEHGPLAMQMISLLCGNDTQKWEDCLQIAQDSLRQRIQLWDAIMDKIQTPEMA